jgi:hypothetical protein
LTCNLRHSLAPSRRTSMTGKWSSRESLRASTSRLDPRFGSSLRLHLRAHLRPGRRRSRHGCFGSTPRRIKLIRLRWSSMPRAPLAYPWEWFEATTSVECPMCGLGSRRLRPSRRRTLVCRGCGTRYNSFTCHIEQEGRPPVVLRSIQVVLNELLDAAGRHEARPSDWQEAQGALAILLERADEALPACRSLQYADPSRLVADPGLVGTAQAEIGLEIARFEQVWGSR